MICYVAVVVDEIQRCFTIIVYLIQTGRREDEQLIRPPKAHAASKEVLMVHM